MLGFGRPVRLFISPDVGLALFLLRPPCRAEAQREMESDLEDDCGGGVIGERGLPGG